MFPRIGIASSGLGHVNRGIEAWAHDLGHALHQHGAEVTLFKGAGAEQQEYEHVIPCWTRDANQTRRLLERIPSFLGWRIGLGSGYGVEQSTFAWNLLKVLRREKIDILHVQDPQVAILVQRAARLGLVHTRTILAHGTEESLAFQQRITFLQHLAPWHLDEARAAGVWKPTWCAIPNFIDTDLFRPGRCNALRDELQIPRDAFVVLVAAAIKRVHKRVDYLLSEFADLRRRHADLPIWFVIAGGWEQDTDELIALGKGMLGDQIRFLVRFPRERMADLYRAADLFTLGSLKEMMPIAVLEATASGLPCLVHRHPVMEWMIGPGGKAIDMSVSGVLADEIARLAIDDLCRRELGELAREHCVANFCRERVVGLILNYYVQVMSAREQAIREQVIA